MVEKTKTMLTKKVMAKSTSDEERLKLLAEYHALGSLMARMGSEAHNAEQQE